MQNSHERQSHSWLFDKALTLFYRPSYNPAGKPCSHDLGVFQGRSDMFSDSVEAHPEASTKAMPARSRHKPRMHFEIRLFINGATTTI